MPSPPTAQTAASPDAPTAAAANAFPPALARRSSFEPMRLGALPPPVFTRGAPGQRSVPAVEYLKQEAAANASTGASGMLAGAGVVSDGTVTPGAGLGNGIMTKEPWNLWSDATAPVVNLPASDLSSTGITVSAEDEELASALAASGLIDKSEGAADNLSKSSSLTPWHEEVPEAVQTGSPNANADAVATANKLKPSNSINDLKVGAPHLTRISKVLTSSISQAPDANSLLPRNVSFSSLLDLPQPTVAGTGGSPIKRATSLKYSPNESSVKANSSSPLASKSLYSSPASRSLGQRQSRTASNSPTQQKDMSSPFNQTGHRHVHGPGSGLPANTPAIGAGAFGPGGGVSPFDGIDAGLGMRSRQPSTFSDASVASMPFGPFLGSGPGMQDPFAPNPYGSRRDSGYGMSMYQSSPHYGNGGRQDKHGNTSYGYNSSGNKSLASFESIYSPSLGPSPYPFSTSGSPESSFSAAGAGTSMVGGQSLIRYPSNGSSNDGMMPSFGIPGPANYGLGVGLVTPASPFMGYGPPVPTMPAGYPFAGLAMSAIPGSDLYGYDKPRRYPEKSMPIRSPLLEDFRADKTRRWEVVVSNQYQVLQDKS